VRFVDLPAQFTALEPEITAAVMGVLARGDYILGRAVTDFETAFAAYCGTGHAMGCANGLDGLTLLLQAAEIGPGDEVITQCNSFAATAYSITRAGARPVLVDCRDDDLSMDLDQIEAAITPATRAIVGVHLYGRLLDVVRLRQIADAHGLLVFEDAAQAHGGIPPGRGSVAGPLRRAGGLSDGGSFSFYPAKNLGAAGDGGMVTTDRHDLAARVRLAVNYGQSERYIHAAPNGTNSRLDTIQAAILLVKLGHLDAWNDRRRQVAGWYATALAESGLHLPPLPPEPREHVWHLYTVRVPAGCDRDRVRSSLAEREIETGLHYPRPIHLQPAFASLNLPRGSFPVAETAAERLISLPMHPFLTQDDVQRVAAALDTALAAQGAARP